MKREKHVVSIVRLEMKIEMRDNSYFSLFTGTVCTRKVSAAMREQ